MRSFLRSCLGLVGTLALAILPAAVGAQAVGSEFQINTYTTLNQGTTRDSVAADASGNFVVVWDSYQDGFASDLRPALRQRWHGRRR